VPTLGLSAELELRGGEDRGAFMRELQDAFTALARKYGARQRETAGERFWLVLACYPRRGDKRRKR